MPVETKARSDWAQGMGSRTQETKWSTNQGMVENEGGRGGTWGVLNPDVETVTGVDRPEALLADNLVPPFGKAFFAGELRCEGFSLLDRSSDDFPSMPKSIDGPLLLRADSDFADFCTPWTCNCRSSPPNACLNEDFWCWTWPQVWNQMLTKDWHLNTHLKGILLYTHLMWVHMQHALSAKASERLNLLP